MRKLLFCLLIATSPAIAQTPKINCDAPMSTMEINYCADKAYAAVDAKLNAVWKKVMAGIDASASDMAPADKWKAAMRDAQRAWITFRDKDCKEVVPFEWSGGSGTSAAVLGCLIEKTEARIKDLEGHIPQ